MGLVNKWVLLDIHTSNQSLFCFVHNHMFRFYVYVSDFLLDESPLWTCSWNSVLLSSGLLRLQHQRQQQQQQQRSLCSGHFPFFLRLWVHSAIVSSQHSLGILFYNHVALISQLFRPVMLRHITSWRAAEGGHTLCANHNQYVQYHLLWRIPCAVRPE